jgi:hypothetical protein
LNVDDYPFAKVLAIADILEATGRTIHRNVWVDAYAADAESALLDGLF